MGQNDYHRGISPDWEETVQFWIHMDHNDPSLGNISILHSSIIIYDFECFFPRKSYRLFSVIEKITGLKPTTSSFFDSIFCE